MSIHSSCCAGLQIEQETKQRTRGRRTNHHRRIMQCLEYIYRIMLIVHFDKDKGIKCTLSKFPDGTKLSGVVDTPEGQHAIHRDLDKLKKWIHGNLMMLNVTKCKVLYLSQDKPQYQHMLWDRGQPCREGLGGAMGERLGMNRLCAPLQPRTPNLSWAASKEVWAAGQGRNFKFNHFMVTVAKMATSLHFTHKIFSVYKQQIKEDIFSVWLPEYLYHEIIIQDDGPRQCPELVDHDCMINSQVTLKLCRICCSSWIPKNIWGLIHPRILTELADVIAKPLSMIFEDSWESRAVPADRNLANVALIFKKEDPRN
ncbi:hypothetical protein WISP_92145 [Willisornis vidua]|uniref:Rna-directed dna polymerase from mobile element jockey-like n=1 Tax=Willisornis vidua TaxID=1566151 RepID=A0ABQ9D6J8_9PASS|nr:hypothetical protein WISP_92145 [Willisornis vidua]